MASRKNDSASKVSSTGSTGTKVGPIKKTKARAATHRALPSEVATTATSPATRSTTDDSTAVTRRTRRGRATTKSGGTMAKPKANERAPAPAGAGPHDAAVRKLRAFGLSYPEAQTRSPWPGHLDLAVRDKTFAFLSIDGEPLRIGCKLPRSAQTALSLPFARPTPYGLGKSGWVTATFEPNDDPPVEFLESWIDESYRAVAPKTLVKKLPPAP